MTLEPRSSDLSLISATENHDSPTLGEPLSAIKLTLRTHSPTAPDGHGMRTETAFMGPSSRRTELPLNVQVPAIGVGGGSLLRLTRYRLRRRSRTHNAGRNRSSKYRPATRATAPRSGAK